MSSPALMEAKSVHTRYVFLDVVGFSRDRSAEAQVDIIAALNRIVSEAISRAAINDAVLLPTGDGLCIGLVDPATRYDAHLQLALEIIAETEAHNDMTPDPMRKFSVRIGINSNLDTVVTDINGRRNLAGAGINHAQALMSHADAGQVLVGATDYEVLRYRERYMRAFREHAATLKHGQQERIYQYIGEARRGLNREVPQALQPPSPQRFPELTAYLLAHAWRDAEWLRSAAANGGQQPFAALLVTYFAALESFVAHHPSHLPETVSILSHLGPEPFRTLMAVPAPVLVEFVSVIHDAFVAPFAEYCESGDATVEGFFVNRKGAVKLKEEWPFVVAETFAPAQEDFGP